MKSRIISIVVIAVFIATVCVFSTLYTERFTDEITKKTQILYEDGAESEKQLEELYEVWERYSEFASLYIEHEELEEITALISRMNESYAESETIFRINCREIELTADHINESQMPKLNNIF